MTVLDIQRHFDAELQHDTRQLNRDLYTLVGKGKLERRNPVRPRSHSGTCP